MSGTQPSIKRQQGLELVDALSFWTQYDSADSFEILHALLGGNIKERRMSRFKGHHMISIGYSPSLDLAAVQWELRRKLDGVGWQFVTTGRSVKLKDGQMVPSFGIAPIVPLAVPVAYHATRACVIERVVDLHQGLLPSNEGRRATTFPDTEGVIHACAKLHSNQGENDSADWWMQHLSRNNIFNDSLWGIVRIEMTGLTEGRGLPRHAQHVRCCN